MTAITQGMAYEIPASSRHEIFGKITVQPLGDGSQRIKAYIPVKAAIPEGMQTGIAIDGSGSMRNNFGGGMLSPIFKGRPNLVLPVAQTICAYLAREVDADGGTTVIYWATGTAGGAIEEVGDLTATQAEAFDFRGPQHYGTGTQLKPAMEYFVEKFRGASSGIYIFITDGVLDDLAEVKRYSTAIAQDIEAGRRNSIKFVIIGLGGEIDEAQMIELDDLDTGTSQDLWLHRLASDMRSVEEIFVESVHGGVIIGGNGIIRDEQGRIVADYRDKGLPALLEFTLPPGSRRFSLEVDGTVVEQTTV